MTKRTVQIAAAATATVLLVAGTAAVYLGMGHGGRSPSTSTESTGVPGGSTPTPVSPNSPILPGHQPLIPPNLAPVTTGLKPPTVGLIDPFGVPRSDYIQTRAITTFVAQVKWADVQTQQGGPIVHPNAIDEALVAARAASPPLGVKIRMFAGIDAPEWAKSIGGPPVAVGGPGARLEAGTVGRFWTPPFQAAYQDVQAKLAATYDQVPEIHDVVISACTTIFAEPFLRQGSVPADRQALLAAGFTVAADHQCLMSSIKAHQVWQHTRSSMSFNPYLNITSASRPTLDEPFTESMMDYCRQQLGPRCTLENNSLRAPISALGPAYQVMYAHMHLLGGAITFQTATPDRIGCLIDSQCPPGVTGVLDWAQAEGATAVELPDGYDTQYPAAVLSAPTRGLTANWHG